MVLISVSLFVRGRHFIFNHSTDSREMIN